MRKVAESAGTQRIRSNQEIEAALVDIISDTQSFRIEDALITEVTGVIDVEKIIRLGRERIYIEKKLPFQIIIIKTPILESEIPTP
ncbi:MAG: hypothetical protein HYY08_04650 [Firmicutes bacterium]|nr:hypothetical protein [Bacillota bacterium]